MAITLADLLKGFNPNREAPDVQGEEIVATAPEPSQYRQGLLGGGFGVGKTGGNILGLLGDALLAQGGRDPIYQQRLQQAREAEALKGFTAFPEEAINKYAQVNPTGGVKAWDSYQDNLRQKENSDILNQDREERYRQGINTRGYSLLKASTPETYSAMRDQVKKYFVSKGVEPDFDIPETFEEASRASPWNADITPQQQDRLDAQRDYQAALLAQRDRAEEGRNRRTDKTLGIRASEGSANRRVKVSEGNANRGVRVSEGEKNRDLRRETAKGGRVRPKIRIEVVNGVRKVIKEQ